MDLSALLDAPPAGPLSTKVMVCPEGEFRAMIDDGEKWITFRDGDASRNLSPQAVILFSILDDGVRQKLGRDKVLVPKTCWLDLIGEGSEQKLDSSEGKNVDLGRLMDAAKVNGQGIRALRGKGPFMVKVAHRSDKNNPDTVYAEVRKVAPIA